MAKYSKIRQIGGKLETDFYNLMGIIDYINSNYFPLFALMGFDSPAFTDRAIDALLSYGVIASAREAYIAYRTERVENGYIKLESLLSKRTLRMEYPNEEEKERVFKREIHRALCFQFKEILRDYSKTNPSIVGFPKIPVQLCREAISISPDGFIVDEGKFIRVYTDYLEADCTESKQQHQAAADAINRFFGGLRITEKEMTRYFVIEAGVVKPNPLSVNTRSYIRLGYKGKAKVKLNKKNDGDSKEADQEP